MARQYQKTTWQDLPSQSTPLSATNLNHIEEGIYNLETKVENNASDISDLQSGKVDKVQGKGLSSNDFTGDDVTKLRYDTYTKQETRNLVDGSYTIAGKKANTTLGSYATAEGQDNTVTGDISHASGYNNTVSGQQSYAEGNSNTVSGNYSHVEGLGNIASGAIQHVSGQYNIADNNNTYAEIVGGGSDNNSRKNIRTLDWEGNARYSGDVYSKNKKIATEEFVEDSLNNFNAQPNVTSGTGIGNAAFVCYGGGKYVATGSNNSNGAWISSNGINWTHIDLPSATTQTLIKYVNGKYIIGLDNGKLIVSEDASNWSVIDTGLPNLKITGIIYDGTNYIVINYGGNVYSSADLTTWTSCGTPANYGLGIAYKTGKYVTIHGNSRTPIYYSTDLSEWHSAIRPSEMELGAIFTNIICGNGIFIVFGVNEEIFYSTDGNIWNKIDYSFAYGGGCIDFSDSEFVMFKGNNNEFHIYYSDNGVLWTVWNETLTNRYSDIAVGISEFNIVGNGRASYFKFKKERYAELLAEKIGDNVEAINKGSVSKPVYFKDGVPKEANEMYSKTETDTLLASELATKVDKVQGKDLSTNDFTDADKIAVSSLGTASTKDVGTANGVAELDSNGKVPSSQLPSYVDDVIEGYYNSSTDRFYKESTFTTVIPLEDGKSWVDISTNKSYRWTGSVYVRVDEGVQLGETSSTAYRGDRGKTAYDHSQATGNPHGTTKSDVGLGNVDNTSDLDKPISTAVQTALNDKVDKVQGKGLSTNDYTTADKNKLAGIEAEANKTVVDSAMSDTSTNPVQNKVITKELEGAKTATGNPITVTDAAPVNAVNLNIDLEPIQDLHGYDHPWVGGAGKNKLPMTVEGIKSANTSGTWSGNVYSIGNRTFKILVDSDNNVIGIKANGTDSGNSQFAVGDYVSLPQNSYIMSASPSGGGTTTYQMFVAKNTSGSISVAGNDTGSGVQVSTDGVSTYRLWLEVRSGYNAQNLTFYPMIRLSTETDPTFEPYTNICPISGRNEVAIDRVGKNLFDKGTVTDGYRFGSDGIPFAQSGYSVSDYIRVDKSTAYVRDKNMNTNECACLYDSNKGFIDRITTGKTFQTTSATCYVRLSMLTTDKDTTQFEKGSTPTTYEPYKGKTYTIQIGQDVYGAQYDVTRGKMVVDRGYIASYNGETLPSTWISDRDVYASGTTPTIGAEVVYELATPITIPLTPQQIRLLKGTNNISCNTGDLSIKYYPDNVLGQLKGDIEGEYDERIVTLEEKASTPTIKQVEINRNAVSTDGSVMFTSLTGHIIVGTSIENDATGNKCVGIPYSMGNIPALKIMNESTMAVLPNITISGILYCIEL